MESMKENDENAKEFLLFSFKNGFLEVIIVHRSMMRRFDRE